MTVDIWYNLGYTPGMKTAISIPDNLFRAADRVAKRLGLSRSELYRRALATFLEREDDAAVTDALNRVYASENCAALDPLLARLQHASLPREEW